MTAPLVLNVNDEFLAMLAHELRNPLAALQMGLPLLERFPARDAIEERTRGAMHRQLAQLTRLVDDLLDVSRVTRGRIELHKQDIELGAFVVQLCDGLRPQLFAPRDQQLTVEVPPDAVPVFGDPTRLEQIVTNLLDNASKYSDPRTQIEVTLRIVDGNAELVVRDHGIGIEPAQLDSVFELFSQVQTSLARASGGLGIGLTLVKALVELHDGTIAATSLGRGSGSAFTIRLPLQQTQVTVDPVPEEHPCGAPTRILLIDDNEDGRDMLRLMCEMRGHAVDEAAEGIAGVERALEMKPDLAIIDLGLPTIDGYEVARRIRAALGEKIQLVALSGYGSPEHRARAAAAGFDEHVAKPMDVDRLERVISLARERRDDKLR